MTARNTEHSQQPGAQERSLVSLSGTRVLVSGATGFIGANLVERLIETGCQVAALARPESDLARLRHLLDRIDLVEADVTEVEPRDLARYTGPVDVVFHLAAAGVVSPGLEPQTIVQTNAAGTLRMLQTADALGSERFVYCGSCFEYGAGGRCREDAALAPLTEYGASKAAGWLLAQAFSRRHALPVVGLRPFNVYGPMQVEPSLVARVIRGTIRGEATALTGGEQRRDFIYVEDVIDGFIRAALADDVTGETFNLCTGRAIAVANLVELVLELMGSEQAPLFGALEYRPTDVPVLSGDPTKAEQRLGWSAATPLRNGLRKAIDWHRDELMCAVDEGGGRRKYE